MNRVERIVKPTYICASLCSLVKPHMMPVFENRKCPSPFTLYHSFPEYAGMKGQAKK